ncbi:MULTISPECIES: 4Fe-4S binding protein [Thermoanaerobacterium]
MIKKKEGGIAYINSDKCKNCRRCVTICPAGAIS